MTKIVILGGGFGGLACALGLEKKLKSGSEIALTLIDARDYHLFTPNLYEVATAEEEFTSVRQLKKSIALPVKEILAGKKISFLRGELKEINQTEKSLRVGIRKVHYDYLVLALGSKTEDYGIAGVKEHVLPFKDLKDAFRVRNAVEFAVQRHTTELKKPLIRIIVAGGGYTGVELAGELAKLKKIVAWKNNYPEEKIEILVLERGPRLIAGLSEKLGRDVFLRLQFLGVRTNFNSEIIKVEKQLLFLANKETIFYDLLIWTAGVKSVEIPFLAPLAKDGYGRIILNAYMQANTDERIFMVGDDCCILDEQGLPVPATAQDAIHQGRFVAEALLKIINHKRPNGYTCLKHGFIVSIGGKWAILDNRPWYISGYFAYLINKLGHLRYYASLVGFWKAWKYLFREMEVFSRND